MDTISWLFERIVLVNAFVVSIPMFTLWIVLFLTSTLVGLFCGRVLWVAGDYVEIDPFVGRSLDIFLLCVLGIFLSGTAILTYPIWR